MNKYLYKIKDLEIPTHLKYWFARKSKVNFDLSQILNGTNFDLENSVNKKLHLINIFGNSVQETTTGKNLLNPTRSDATASGVSISYDAETQILTLNGECTQDNLTFSLPNNSIHMENGDTIYLLVKYISGTSNGYFSFRCFNSNFSALRHISISDPIIQDLSYSSSITSNIDFTKISIRVDNGSTFNDFKFKLMVSKVDAIYEPYTNGASPNPKYPQEIKSSGDNGYITEKIVNENLVDFTDMTSSRGTTFTFIDNVLTVSSERDVYNNANIEITNLIKSNKGKILSFGYDDIIEVGSVIKTFQLVIYNQQDRRSYHNFENNNYKYNIPNDVSDIKKVIFQILQNNKAETNAGTLIIEKPILYFGEVKPEYVEHQEQLYTIPCQQPMRAIGNVKDTFVKVNGVWYERHNIGEFIANNNLLGNGITDDRVNLRTPVLDIQPNLTGNTFKENVMCNLLQKSVVDNSGLGGTTSTGEIRVILSKNYATTYSEANQYLTEKALKIQWVKEEPLDLPCTQAQITALEALMKARTYKNITHIYSNDEVPADLQIQYYKEKEEE